LWEPFTGMYLNMVYQEKINNCKKIAMIAQVTGMSLKLTLKDSLGQSYDHPINHSAGGFRSSL